MRREHKEKTAFEFLNTQKRKDRLDNLKNEKRGDVLKGFYPLTVKGKTKVELELCELMGYEYKGHAFSGSVDFDKIHTKLRGDNLKTGSIDNRRQKSFGVITLQDSVDMVMAEKTFAPSQYYPFEVIDKETKTPDLSRRDRLELAFGECTVGGERYIFSRQTHHKLKEDNGKITEIMPTEVSMYVIGQDKKETLLFRFDSSGQDHKNEILLGSKPGQVFNRDVKGYHLHFQSLFVNAACHKQGFKNGAPTHGVAVDIGNLSDYLKGLDLEKGVQPFDATNLPNYAEWDLKSNYSLPFKSMHDMGKYPQVDLTKAVKELQASCTNSDIQTICTNYLNAIKSANPNSFQSLIASLDFLNNVEQTFTAIKSFTPKAELFTIKQASTEAVSQIADGLVYAQQLDKQNINDIVKDVENSIANENAALDAAAQAKVAEEAAKAAAEQMKQSEQAERQRLLKEVEKQKEEAARLAEIAKQKAQEAQTKAAVDAAKQAEESSKNADKSFLDAAKVLEENKTPEQISFDAAKSLVDNATPNLTPMLSTEKSAVQSSEKDGLKEKGD